MATLRELGIRNNSLITLHSIDGSEGKGLPSNETSVAKKETENVHILETHVPTHEANHSYNGVMFDIESHVRSFFAWFHIGVML